MSTTPAAQLARLRVQFPAWQFARTDGGVVAAHRITGTRLYGRTATDLETQLLRWSLGRER